ncbi:MAG: hypothetical protein M1812_006336 [Candelaria pacifica]|nr:MAG: hypothetical protein M1812_006336 [Candelaria pacifica]
MASSNAYHHQAYRRFMTRRAAENHVFLMHTQRTVPNMVGSSGDLSLPENQMLSRAPATELSHKEAYQQLMARDGPQNHLSEKSREELVAELECTTTRLEESNELLRLMTDLEGKARAEVQRANEELSHLQDELREVRRSNEAGPSQNGKKRQRSVPEDATDDNADGEGSSSSNKRQGAPVVPSRGPSEQDAPTLSTAEGVEVGGTSGGESATAQEADQPIGQQENPPADGNVATNSNSQVDTASGQAVASTGNPATRDNATGLPTLSFSIDGVTANNKSLADVSVELHNIVVKAARELAAKNSNWHTVPRKVTRCAYNRVIRNGKLKDNGPAVACQLCVKKKKPCIETAPGQTPVILPLPARLRGQLQWSEKGFYIA